MRNREIVWGLVIVAVGVLLLLGNLGYGGLPWDLIWRLWPGLLLYAGFVRIFEYLGV